jgi:rhomboid protease GluP
MVCVPGSLEGNSMAANKGQGLKLERGVWVIFLRNETFKEYVKVYPVTSLIVLINTVMFLLTVTLDMMIGGNVVLKWGSFHGPLIDEGQWYRLFTPIILHVDWIHFTMNNFTIVLFSPFLEKGFGKIKFLTLYIILGLGSSIALYFLSYENFVAGASGAIFGLLGIYLYLSLFKKDYLDEYTNKMIKVFVILNLIVTFLIPKISIVGHVGGLVVGVLISLVLPLSKLKNSYQQLENHEEWMMDGYPLSED